jgi:UDPglucose 6-dehydrogenase
MYRISVIGTGYVGLVTGACLADFGNEVICVDKIPEKIEMLKRLEIPFFEPGLKELVQRNADEGRIRFTTDLEGAVGHTPVIFIAVGTPSGADGKADLSAVFEVAGQVAHCMQGYRLIVQKSTVPVGTGRRIQAIVKENLTGDHPFDVASNPEFLREGSAVQDFTHPNRVVVGTWTTRAENIISDIYKPLYLLETPMVKTTVETAELIKYASNAFLATKISFINEMANLCEALGADVQTVAHAMGLDQRIGKKFLHAGPGYGGSCFPKDTRALESFAREAGEPMRIIEAVIAVNEAQVERMFQKIQGVLGDLNGKTVGVLGLSFKPNTDDIRDAPAIRIIQRLLEHGAKVRAFDPVAIANAGREVPGAEYCAGAYEVCDGADALAVVTEWNEFRRLDLERIKSLLRQPHFFDFKNIYSPAEVDAKGLHYVGVGRPFEVSTTVSTR